MAELSDFEVVIYGSARARKALFWLFLLSLLADVEMILAPILIRGGLVRSPDLGSLSHLLWSGIGITLVVGAGIFWLSMFYLFMRATGRGIVLWMIWMAAFVLANIFGAQLYYLFAFRKQVRTAPALRG
jgi:hypothetical protein